MPHTWMITGANRGIGLALTIELLRRGDHVVAAARNPWGGALGELAAAHPAALLPLELDVTSDESVAAAKGALDGRPIDVLVNNAGIGLLNVLEGIAMETVREVFETNTVGTIAMTQAVIPQFRERGAGVIVNVTSSVTLRPLHLLSIYTASKAAVNAFSASLQLELEPFGIRVRAIAPGRAPSTAFGENAMGRSMASGIPAPYNDLAQTVMARLSADGPVTHASDVSEAVWRAATDPATPMLTPAGEDAIQWAAA